MINSLYPFAREWSDGGSVWLYSDPHFDDPDSKLMNPNWPDSLDQIATFLNTCYKGDTLVILGDVGNPAYLDYLECYKVLVMGNHDSGKSNYEEYFDEIYKGPVFISDRILLSHEPIYLPYALNIHGHVHNGAFKRENAINVCADVINFTPVSLGKLIKGGVLSGIPNIHRYTIDKE